MKNKTAYFVICLLVLTVIGLSVNTVEAKPANSKAPDMQFVQEVFIDYGINSHAGNGPHPTTESSDFKLTQGGINWFAGPTIKYQIIGIEGVAGGNTAINTAVGTWDGFITTRTFVHDNSFPTVNPCGGVNTVQWLSIDGPSGVLASVSVCRDVATKEIAGFVIRMDSDDSWVIGSVLTKFDVENVASHEFGHVAGLGHGNSPKSGCLTMYKFSTDGEIQKRTLGLGDKLGMDRLYNTGLTSSGPGCGA